MNEFHIFRNIRTPHGLVYFAGTETAVRCAGYMDGAVESGERSANEILCAMGKIDDADVCKAVEQALVGTY